MGRIESGLMGRGALLGAAVMAAIALGTAVQPSSARAANGLEPILGCVDYLPGQNLVTAHFGYSNVNGVPITPSPDQNYFDPPPFFRGQPLVFQPGTYRDVFQVTFDAGGSLTWNLFGSSVTASNDPRNYCDDGPDLTPPDTAILEGPRGPTASRSASFQLFAEAGATFECSLDDGPFAGCASPLELTGLADGEHTLRVRASDRGGNVDQTPAARTWTVDATGPDAPAITGPASGAADRDGSFNLRGLAEPGSTVRVFSGGTRIGTGETDPWTGAWSVGVVDAPEGRRSYRATATDAVGNPSPASRPVTVRIDSAPPRVLEVTPRGRRTPPGVNPTVRFSEPVDPASLTEGDALILRRRGHGDAVRASVTYDGATRAATLDPERRLRRGEGYVARVSSQVRDAAGNRLGGPVRWSFKVR